MKQIYFIINSLNSFLRKFKKTKNNTIIKYLYRKITSKHNNFPLNIIEVIIEINSITTYSKLYFLIFNLLYW